MHCQSSKFANVMHEVSQALELLIGAVEHLCEGYKKENATMSQVIKEGRQHKRDVIAKGVELWKSIAKTEALKGEIIELRQKLVDVEQLANVLKEVDVNNVGTILVANLRIMTTNEETQKEKEIGTKNVERLRKPRKSWMLFVQMLISCEPLRKKGKDNCSLS
ncbi:hypothetical protein V6N13_133676 [Hibiscus sabdariffa]